MAYGVIGEQWWPLVKITEFATVNLTHSGDYGNEKGVQKLLQWLQSSRVDDIL